MDAKLKKLIDSYPSLVITEDDKKVKCSLTGHEMPCKVDAIEAYIKGKRFQRLSAAKPSLDPSVYSEFLVPSNKPKHEKQLFCKLTFRHLNDLPHHIALHVNGKRFQRAYERWKKCQETGEMFKANVGRTKPRTCEGDRDNADEVAKKKRKKSGKRHNNEDAEEVGDGNIDLEEDDDDDDDNDSLSDLYPVEYFEKLEISAEMYNPFKLNGFKAEAAASSSKKSSNLKRKMQNKKKPAALKTVKAKKSKP